MINYSLAETADYAWRILLDDVLTHGHRCETRGTTSLELVGYQTKLNMRDCIITSPGRKLGYKFQAAEAAWIMSGDDRVETISPYSKTISQFSDDGVTYFGAYGPKVCDQVVYVRDKLNEDPQSRQAVINIWREKPPKTKDVPCTLSLQFLVRSGEIHCVASMRSSDAWLGWPYDVFNFSCLSLGLAAELDSKPKLGTLTLNAGSQHLYDRDADSARKILEEREETERVRLPETVVGYTELVEDLKTFADTCGSLEGFRTLKRS